MTGRSIDIALTEAEAGFDMFMLHENMWALAMEPELEFPFASNEDLKKWGFIEGYYSTFCKNEEKCVIEKDIIIQLITTYQSREGAIKAYNADADYFSKNDYGNTIKTKTLGDSSILLKKKKSDAVVYTLNFLKNTVHATISGMYKKDKPGNIEHILELAEKVNRKIPEP